MNEYKLTGGARIGKTNATYPLAILKVNKESLELSAGIKAVVFQSSDILSIEPYNKIPIIGQGIKITHKVDSYDTMVVFWTRENLEWVIEQIKGTGFLDKNNTVSTTLSQTIIEKQKSGSSTYKKPFLIIMVVLWNVSILSGFLLPILLDINTFDIFHGIILALSIMFSASLLSIISSNFRSLILKKGRNSEDIKRFSYFLLFISGFMLFPLIRMLF